MALPMRRPLLAAVGQHPFERICPQQQRQRRSFHAAAVCLAGWEAKQQKPRVKPERSVRIAAQEQGKMSSDLGILPDTFIRPTGSNRPSIFTSPLSTFKLEYKYLKYRAFSLLQLLIYKWQSPKPRLVLSRRLIAPTAIGLHASMSSAFASKDTKTLQRICSDGLRDSLEARMRARAAGEVWSWEMLRVVGAPRVVSHRSATLGVEGMGIRQAVVRVRSVQRLTRYKGGKVVVGSGVDKEVLEYVVVQRRMVGGREEEWMVWGTTEETTLEILEAREKEKLSL